MLAERAAPPLMHINPRPERHTDVACSQMHAELRPTISQRVCRLCDDRSVATKTTMRGQHEGKEKRRGLSWMRPRCNPSRCSANSLLPVRIQSCAACAR